MKRFAATIHGMARHARALFVILAGLALSTHALGQPSNASGTLTVNGKAVQLRYAYAFRDATSGATRVLVSSAPLTAPMLSAETGLRDSRGQSALRDLVRKGEASAIELFVADGRMETVMVFSTGFNDPTPCSSDNSYWFEP